MLVSQLETVRKYLRVYRTKLIVFFPRAGLFQEQWVESWKVEKNCLKMWCDKRRQLKEMPGFLNPFPATSAVSCTFSFICFSQSILPNMPTFQNYSGFGMKVSAAAKTPQGVIILFHVCRLCLNICQTGKVIFLVWLWSTLNDSLVTDWPLVPTEIKHLGQIFIAWICAKSF